MKNLLLLACIMLIQSTFVNAQPKNDIPIIDRSIFFGNPEISGGQLSPNGEYISFLKEYNGIMNIWVKKINEPFHAAKRLTNLERPSAGYFWTYDGKYIVYAKDNGGNENYNIYAVSPTENGQAGSEIPINRNLTPMENVRAQILMVSKKDPNKMMIGLNNRDAKWHDVYELEINSGKLTLVKENKDRLSGWVFDWDENPRVAIRNPEDGSTEFLTLENGNTKKIYSVSAMETVTPLSFTKDNKNIYVITNKGNDVNFTKLVLMNPSTGAVKDVEKDPLNKVDLENVSFSEVSKSILYTSYIDEKERLYFKDKNYEADYKYLKLKFPNSELTVVSNTVDEKKWLFSVYGDTKVASVYFFDRASKKIIEQYTPRPKLKKYESYLSPMKPISYKSSDGLVIPAYITVPKNSTGKNMPLLVFPHGGPWARSYWGFNSFAQFFANRGFVVLDPNFRGSTGYGKKFLDAGNLQWGKLMQDDITWGVKYLIQQGIVDAKRVAIMGGSYGGYATLAGLAFTPDVYAAGVDIVGPSNLFTLLSTIPPYWEAGRKIFTLRMGDEATESGKEILKSASPLFSANKIKAPLLIIQGANDPRVKQAESDQIVVALRNLGRDVQYVLAADEGHGFSKPINNLAMFAKSEKFLAQYLGTRYQQEMTEDVAKKLNEMTVDISKVTLAERPKIAVLNAMPVLSKGLEAGTYQYDINIKSTDNSIPLEMTRTISNVSNGWKVVDIVKSSFINMGDEVILNQNNLDLLHRFITQGQLDIDIAVLSNNVTVNMKEQKKELASKGLVLSDGAASDLIYARLPLTEGYKTSFYAVDLTTIKLNQMLLEVMGKEKINNVNCWKLIVVNIDNPAEKTTMWIDPNKLMAVKMEQTMPSLGNSVMTVVLK